MTKRTARSQAAAAIVALVFSLAIVAIPLAAQNPDSNGQSAVVVAHLPLSGHPATQMLLQRREDKQYLYVDQGDQQGVLVIDVTRPSHPSVVERTAWPARTAEGQVQPLGSGLAVSERPDGRVAAVSRRPARQTVNVLDMTDAAHPQVLQTFSGVTSMLPDTDRNLIFITNADGLWIVRHRVSQAAYAQRHLCTSESALNPEPDCY